MRRCVAILSASVLVAGCVSTPQFDKISGVTPKSIVDVIECELIAAKAKIDRRNAELSRTKGIRPESLDGWIAVAELSLQVDEQATLTPAFTHTDVVSKNFSRVFDWGVKLDSQSQRIYSETVSFKIGALRGPCEKPPSNISLNGSLGLTEVVEMAFGSVDVEGEPGIGIGTFSSSTAGADEKVLRDRAKGGGSRRGAATKGKREAAFGTSIEFLVIKGLSATGPTWNLKYFKGPGKLFTTERNDTHKVTISFAKEGGEGEARNMNNQINLQGLTSSIKQLKVPN